MKLLTTKGTILAEASEFDAIWGIGMSIKDERLCNQSIWGCNKLGLILMDIRQEIEDQIYEENACDIENDWGDDANDHTNVDPKCGWYSECCLHDYTIWTRSPE